MACISTIRSDLWPVFDFEGQFYLTWRWLLLSVRAALMKIMLPVPGAVIPYKFYYQCTHTTDPQQMKSIKFAISRFVFRAQMHKHPFSAGAVAWTPLGELTLLQAPSRLGRAREVNSRHRGGREGRYPLLGHSFPVAPCFSGPSTQITGYASCQGATLIKILTLTLALTLYKNT